MTAFEENIIKQALQNAIASDTSLKDYILTIPPSKRTLLPHLAPPRTEDKVFDIVWATLIEQQIY